MDYDALSNPEFKKYMNDYRVQAMKKAIRQKESGNKYDAVGDNGTSYGAYQFQKKTWENMSRKYAGTVLEPTPKNQDYVMIMDIGNAIEKEGLTPDQYLSRHNSGNPNAHKSGSRGFNSTIGVAYDVPKYVNEGMSLFNRYKEQEKATRGATQQGATGDGQVLIGERITDIKGPLDQQEFATRGQKFSDINSGVRKTALTPVTSESDPTSTKFGRFTRNLGSGVLRSLSGAGDFVATALNQGIGITDDPAFQFGTATRKLKNEELFRGQNPAQKAGVTIGDIGQVIGTMGIEGAVSGAVKGAPAVARLANSVNKAARFAGKTLPAVAGNVAQGAVLQGLGGDAFTPKSVAIDTLAPIGVRALGTGYRALKNKGLFGQAGKQAFMQAEAENLVKNPQAYESFVQDATKKMRNYVGNTAAITDDIQSFQMRHNSDPIEFLVRNNLVSVDNGNFNKPLSLAKAKEIQDGSYDIIRQITDANRNPIEPGIFGRAISDAFNETRLPQMYKDKASREIIARLQGLDPEYVIDGKLSGKPISLSDLSQLSSDMKIPFREGAPMRDILKVESAAKNAINSLIIQNAGTKEAQEVISEALDVYKKTKDAEKIIKAIGSKPVKSWITQRTAGILSGMLAAGGGWNPFAYAAGSVVGGEVASLMNKIHANGFADMLTRGANTGNAAENLSKYATEIADQNKKYTLRQALDKNRAKSAKASAAKDKFGKAKLKRRNEQLERKKLTDLDKQYSDTGTFQDEIVNVPQGEARRVVSEVSNVLESKKNELSAIRALKSQFTAGVKSKNKDISLADKERLQEAIEDERVLLGEIKDLTATLKDAQDVVAGKLPRAYRK